MRYAGTELELFAQAVGWKRYVRDVLRPFIGGHVLEVGAGMGAFTQGLTDIPCRSWCCLEPDPVLSERLDRRRSHGDFPRPVEVVRGTLADLGGERRFDTILYLDVLEHVAEDGAEAEAAARRLACGGRIVVLAPAFQMAYSSFDAAVGHHRRYTRQSLERLRPKALKTEASLYLDAPGLALSLANRLLLRAAEPKAGQILFWDRHVIPLARILDPLVGHSFGRSVVAVWQKAGAAATWG